MNFPIKVMLVDDAFLIRVALRTMLDQDPQKRFKVVASVQNGEDAISMVKTEDIDVVILDVEMPKKNGLEALEEIMKIKPIPVIMFSSLTKKDAKETIKALSLGAVDFMTKSSRDVTAAEKGLKEELHEKIIRAHSINRHNLKPSPAPVIKPPAPKPKMNFASPIQPVKKIHARTGEKLSHLIAIGCSTGGPTALQKIFTDIPKDLKAGIVVVQHMPPGGYTASLAEHLNQLSAFTIKEAEDGDEIIDGTVYIAPGGYHLEVFRRGGKFQCVLNKREHVSGHRPSVDTMFKSIARMNEDIPTYGVVLTGMGSDGTEGAKALKEKNATILAESDKTAVIFGMPKQVINKGLADHVEDLDKIVSKLHELIP